MNSNLSKPSNLSTAYYLKPALHNISATWFTIDIFFIEFNQTEQRAKIVRTMPQNDTQFPW